MADLRRGLTVAGIMAGMLLAGLDALAVGTAMPTIVEEIGGLALYPWAFTAYMLTAAVTMPLFGKAADAIGRRASFTAGVIAFVAGSVVCALAPSMLVFVAGRAVQGVGAGAMFSLPFALIGVLFPPEERAKAVGFLAAVWALSSVMGPLLGTLIIEFASWPWVFWINVPVGAVSIALVVPNLTEAAREPRHPARARGGVDLPGALVMILATAGLLVGLDRGMLWLALAALPLFAVLYHVERRAADPLVPVRYFKDARMRAAILAGFLAHFAAFGAIAFAPLVVQTIEGGARAAGFTLFPLSVMWSTTSLVGGRFVPRVGERRFVIAGMTALVVTLVAGYFLLPLGLPWAGLVMGGIGLSMGLQTPSLLTSVQNQVPVSEMGQATSLLQFVRQIGNSTGIAAWGLVVLGAVAGADALPGASRTVSPDALPAGVLVGLAAALAGLVVAFRLPRGGHRPGPVAPAASTPQAPGGGRD